MGMLQNELRTGYTLNQVKTLLSYKCFNKIAVLSHNLLKTYITHDYHHPNVYNLHVLQKHSDL